MAIAALYDPFWLQAASVTYGKKTVTHNQAHCTCQDGNTHHNWLIFYYLKIHEAYASMASRSLHQYQK